MLIEFIFTFGIVIMLLLMVALFVVKAGLQLQHLKIEKKKKPGSIMDFVQFDYGNEAERKLRWQAFLLFPLMYGVDLDSGVEELNDIRRKIKRIHIGIYIILIVLIIMSVYSEKVYPENS